MFRSGMRVNNETEGLLTSKSFASELAVLQVLKELLSAQTPAYRGPVQQS